MGYVITEVTADLQLQFIKDKMLGISLVINHKNVLRVAIRIC